MAVTIFYQEPRSAHDQPMVQAECRERACSSYAEATPIDAERKREPEGPAQRAQQPRSARDRTGARRASAKRAAICVQNSAWQLYLPPLTGLAGWWVPLHRGSANAPPLPIFLPPLTGLSATLYTPPLGGLGGTEGDFNSPICMIKLSLTQMI